MLIRYRILPQWGDDEISHIGQNAIDPSVVEVCAKSGRTLRGIEEDYVGIDIVHHFTSLFRKGLKTFQRFVEVIAMARRMVGRLWRFHDFGFIHGDFHVGNGAFKVKKPEGSSYSALKDEMVLIDFGKEQFIPKTYGTDDSTPRRENLNEALLSPWHLKGYRLGRRDDLFRALESTALLLSSSHGLNINECFTKSETSDSIRMKMMNFFDPEVANKGGIYCCPNTSQTEPLFHMKNAMDIILAIEHPDESPKYEEIMRDINMALFSLDLDSETRE